MVITVADRTLLAISILDGSMTSAKLLVCRRVVCHNDWLGTCNIASGSGTVLNSQGVHLGSGTIIIGSRTGACSRAGGSAVVAIRTVRHVYCIEIRILCNGCSNIRQPFLEGISTDCGVWMLGATVPFLMVVW